VTRARWKRSAVRCDLVAIHSFEMIRKAGGDVRLLSGTVSKTYEYRDTSMGSCVIMGRKRSHQRAARVRPPSPEQDAKVTAPSPWMFAAPPIKQTVWASRSALRGRFATTVIEDVASHPIRVPRCALRSDDTPTRARLPVMLTLWEASS
jgi:hypothetical protein